MNACFEVRNPSRWRGREVNPELRNIQNINSYSSRRPQNSPGSQNLSVNASTTMTQSAWYCYYLSQHKHEYGKSSLRLGKEGEARNCSCGISASAPGQGWHTGRCWGRRLPTWRGSTAWWASPRGSITRSKSWRNICQVRLRLEINIGEKYPDKYSWLLSPRREGRNCVLHWKDVVAWSQSSCYIASCVCCWITHAQYFSLIEKLKLKLNCHLYFYVSSFGASFFLLAQPTQTKL